MTDHNKCLFCGATLPPATDGKPQHQRQYCNNSHRFKYKRHQQKPSLITNTSLGLSLALSQEAENQQKPSLIITPPKKLALSPPAPTTHSPRPPPRDRQPTTTTTSDKTRHHGSDSTSSSAGSGDSSGKRRRSKERRLYPSDVLNAVVEEDVEAGELPGWIEAEATIPRDSSSKTIVRRVKREHPIPSRGDAVADSDAHFFRFKYEFMEPLPSGFCFVGEKQGGNGKYYSVFASGVRLERNRESLIVYITRPNTEDNAFRAMRLAMAEATLIREELLERYPVLKLSGPIPVTSGHYEFFDPVARALYDQGEVRLPHRTPETQAQYDASPRPGMIGFRDPHSAERFRSYRREMYGDHIKVEEANAYADNALALREGLDRVMENMVVFGEGMREHMVLIKGLQEVTGGMKEAVELFKAQPPQRQVKRSFWLALDIMLYNAGQRAGFFVDKFIGKFIALRRRRKQDGDGREGGLRRLARRLR